MDLSVYIGIALAFTIWNFFTFVVTAKDKIAAVEGKWRTPEKRFIIFSLLFGGIGVLIAFYTLRHKTKHKALMLGVWIFTILSYALLGAGVYFFILK